MGILSMVLGCILIYGLLLGFGYIIYGNTLIGSISCFVALISALLLYKFSNYVVFVMYESLFT